MRILNNGNAPVLERAVLEEQVRGDYEGILDPGEISKVSIESSGHCVQTAHNNVARDDAHLANVYQEKERSE